jgi:hypothetical protein
MKDLYTFLIKLLVFTVVAGIVIYFANPVIPEQFRFRLYPLLLVFFMLATLLFHVGLLRSASRSNQAFVRYYMAAAGVKLFLFMGIIILYALLKRPDTVGFIVNFFVMYIGYTVFEVSLVYHKFSNLDHKIRP